MSFTHTTEMVLQVESKIAKKVVQMLRTSQNERSAFSITLNGKDGKILSAKITEHVSS